jgi:hypothetical protein
MGQNQAIGACESLPVAAAGPRQKAVVALVTQAAGSPCRCSLWLESNDYMQCRFAVKNDDKDLNRSLDKVQTFGYVEYKARYCKKRGQAMGYGNFHLSFLPYDE